MGLFEKLEKLINEHGSAAIQEKHIAFFKDELAMLKKQLKDVESHMAELDTAAHDISQWEREVLQEAVIDIGKTREELPRQEKRVKGIREQLKELGRQ